MVAHQLHEPVANRLLTAVLLRDRQLFLYGVEQPHQQTLQEIILLLLPERGYITAKKHLCHIHP